MTMQQSLASRVPLNAVTITNRNVGALPIAGTAVAGYRLGLDGIGYFRSGNATSVYNSIPGEWMNVGPIGAYSVKATKNGGTEAMSNDGVMLDFSVDRTWQISGTALVTLNFLVELFYYGVKVGQAQINLSAEVSPD